MIGSNNAPILEQKIKDLLAGKDLEKEAAAEGATLQGAAPPAGPPPQPGKTPRRPVQIE